MALSSTQTEELGRRLLAEIGLKEPHIVLKTLRGFLRVDRGRREIAAPWPTSTPEALYVLAHELGHWHLHTRRLPSGHWAHCDLPRHVKEYESERYARQRLRDLGVPLPPVSTDWGKQYVGNTLRKDLRESTDTPDIKVVRWAEVDVAKERQAEWGLSAWRMLGRASRGIALRADLLLGSVPKNAAAGLKVNVFAVSAAGKQWAGNAAHLTQIGSKDEYALAIEDMVDFVGGAKRAGLRLKRA